MTLEQIILIASAGVFVFLLLILIITSLVRKNKLKKAHEELYALYRGDKLAKMEYDLASYDEETYKLLNGNKGATQMTLEDVISDGLDTPVVPATTIDETLFEKIESDGLEELTGNYKKDGE